MKKFVLVYIALRSTVLVFYDTHLLPGISVTDFVGVTFPALLLYYYFTTEEKPFHFLNHIIIIWFGWMILSSVLEYFVYNTNILGNIIMVFKFLNAFAVFLVFPALFKTKEDVNMVVNAFLISSLFPLAQGIAQQVFGPTFLGMMVMVRPGGIQLYSGFYGNYGTFSLLAEFGLMCLIYKFKQMELQTGLLWKLFYIFLFVAYLALALMTLSRTLFIIVSTISIAILMGFKLRKNIPFLVLMIMALGYIATTDYFTEKYESILARSQSEIAVMEGEQKIEHGMHGRVGRWGGYLEKFYEQYTPAERILGTDINIGPHGDYFYWLFRYGYVGIGLYISFFICLTLWCFVRYFKCKDPLDKAYGRLALVAILAWLFQAVTSIPSLTTDSSLFILGNISIFLNMKLKDTTQRSRDASFAQKPIYEMPALQ
ncbi:MAG: hypothetical protein WD077_02560 [Bacteroidia bacterium]